MSTSKAYEIVHESGKGMVLKATTDLLPGSVVFREKKPLLHFSEAHLRSYKQKDKNMSVFVAAYYAFKDLGDAEKKQYLNLFGPVDSAFGEKVATTSSGMGIQLEDETFSLNAEEVETFTKVAAVWRYNAFNVQKHDYRGVFTLGCRISHSCQPNFLLDFVDQGCVLRAFVSIAAGEELTIEYNAARRLLPTHKRRLEYASMKEFTCHCERCDAMADDTRAFDCFNPTCTGTMYACQPLSAEIVQQNVHAYTNVEYVEPHLLPCTLCQLAPPLPYQQDMLQLEATLPDVATQLDLPAGG